MGGGQEKFKLTFADMGEGKVEKIKKCQSLLNRLPHMGNYRLSGSMMLQYKYLLASHLRNRCVLSYVLMYLFSYSMRI